MGKSRWRNEASGTGINEVGVVFLRVALLTGGGDSSAINAAIRAVVRKGIAEGFEIIGMRSGSVRAGRGSGSTEVPRGILFHEYEYNQDGECVWANSIIPTNQNHANIQKDLETLVPEIKDSPQEEIELTAEMLVRAYDPCISCSTHCVFL